MCVIKVAVKAQFADLTHLDAADPALAVQIKERRSFSATAYGGWYTSFSLCKECSSVRHLLSVASNEIELAILVLWREGGRARELAGLRLYLTWKVVMRNSETSKC
jgi:hypothetical protein